MSQIDNIIIQVRARLQALSIKLWLEPYYYDEVGCVEDEIEVNSRYLWYWYDIADDTCLFLLRNWLKALVAI